MRIDRDREQELATTVQARRKTLLSLLTKDERKTTRRHGSADAETFEDHARELAEFAGKGKGYARADAVRQALDEYVEAVNLFWTYTQENEVDGYLAATWRQKHKGYAWISFDDLACEALFKLRHFIGLFKPNNGNLADYAMRGVHQHLTEFAAKQGPIEIAQKAARGAGVGPDAHRQSVDLMDDMMEHEDVWKDDDNTHRQHPDAGSLSYDPYDLIDARIDGDITDDDL